MNEKLKNLPDGFDGGKDDVCWFHTAALDGRSQDFGEIYWPFALHCFVSSDSWRVTHLPSGYKVQDGMTRRTARKLIDRLRALPVDWEFKQPRGKKWQVVKVAAGPIVKAVKRVA